jgi:hypothetical protein
MSDPSRSLPFLLRATGLAALLGLGAGAAPWEHAALASHIGLVLLLAAPWLVVLWSAATDPGEARWRRPLSILLLLAASALVLVTLWAGRG